MLNPVLQFPAIVASRPRMPFIASGTWGRAGKKYNPRHTPWTVHHTQGASKKLSGWVSLGEDHGVVSSM